MTDGTVSDYRAYLMDPDGHITDVELISALSDTAAWAVAVASQGQAKIELWCRDREVPQFRHS